MRDSRGTFTGSVVEGGGNVWSGDAVLYLMTHEISSIIDNECMNILRDLRRCAT